MIKELAKKIDKTLAIALVSWIILFIYFYVYFFGHLQFLEQYQLLIFTDDYIGGLLSRPGGLSDFIGRFITQFCYARLTGAIVVALLFIATLLSSAKVIEYFTGRICSVRALALPTLLLIFLFNEYAQMSFVVAITLAQSLFLCNTLFKGKWGYSIFLFTGTIIGYWLIGPASMVYLLLSIGDVIFKRKNDRHMVTCCIAAALLFIVIFLSFRLLPYRLHTMIWGVDYIRYSAEIPLVMYGCLAIPIVILIEAHYTERYRSKIEALWGWCIGFIVCGGIVALNYIGASQSEQFKQMDYWVRCGRWDKVIKTAKKGPKSQLALVYTNLALGMEGQLINRVGQFPQLGTRGLLNDWKRDCITAIPLAEVWYRMGNMNTGLRYTMEAMEANTDFEKSGRALERMAEINLINGDYAVCKKYCHILLDSWFYKKKAEKMLAMIEKPETIDQHPEYGYMRRVRYEGDFIFNKYKFHPEEAIKHLGMQNAENRLARDYYVVWMQMAQNEKRVIQDDEQVR